MFGTSAS
ncbi:hypothetical protein F383_35583 [Gossypium arboreum]|nr:hypothetical protein F383_35583 [Gossypium arboreum]